MVIVEKVMVTIDKPAEEGDVDAGNPAAADYEDNASAQPQKRAPDTTDV